VFIFEYWTREYVLTVEQEEEGVDVSSVAMAKRAVSMMVTTVAEGVRAAKNEGPVGVKLLKVSMEIMEIMFHKLALSERTARIVRGDDEDGRAEEFQLLLRLEEVRMELETIEGEMKERLEPIEVEAYTVECERLKSWREMVQYDWNGLCSDDECKTDNNGQCACMPFGYECFHEKITETAGGVYCRHVYRFVPDGEKRRYTCVLCGSQAIK